MSRPSQNPYDDLKAAILQHTQPFAAEKVEKLLHQGCIGDLKPTALLKKMKLLAPGDSFDTDFRKLLYFKKLPFYIEPILANALNTEPIGSLADMADYIIETAGLPRTEEIPYSSHLAPTKSEPPTAWEEHMLKLEAKIGALHFRGANYAAAHSIDAGDLSPDTPQDPEDTKIKLIREMSHPSSSGGNYRNSGTSYLINSGAEISVIPSTPANRNSSDHPLILAAANDSPIKTYGQKSVTLDLGLRRTFRWIFTIADVSKPIIGADFLCHFGFLLDLCRKKLLDPLTGLHSKYTEYPCPTYCPITYLTNPVCRDKPVNHPATHSITTNGNPVKARVRRLSPTRYKSAKDEFEHILDLDIVRHFSSNLWNKKIFSKIDLVRAYNQIPVAETDVPKTTIATPFGLFEFLRMPFGLRNAAQTLQRFIDEIVFERLNSYGLIINLSKSEIGRTILSFLCRALSAKGFRPTDEKVKEIQHFPQPKSLNQLRLLKKSTKANFSFPPEAVTAVGEVKALLTESTTLANQEPDATATLSTGASQIAVGAVLEQRTGDAVRPPAFFSAKLTPFQTLYSTFGLELLAIFTAVKHFRYFLKGRQFTIFTDHKPLTYASQWGQFRSLFSTRNPASRSSPTVL
ncbi:unnamed protein product [Hymenolepis diminuta]|uniref:RT_RNaseH_2 domain-containing protein n=1 Tax=Hymenolepis diminuta TaxID=6216 RepID=A0A0R3SZE1_HYMDI|nr:unnamed protein product [Hymenolepis diminuta]